MARLFAVTETETPFVEWLKERMREQGFYVPRTDHYLMAEFARVIQERCDTAPTNLQVSVGRYLSGAVIPDPRSCVGLAAGLECHPIEVMIAAGYVTRELVMDYARQQQEQRCGQEPTP